MAAKRTITRRGYQYLTFLVGFFVVIAMWAGRDHLPTMIDKFDLALLDFRLAPHRIPPIGTVAIAAVDDRSIDSLGRWPWPRSVLAQLVLALRDYKVAEVGFDVEFSETDPADVARGRIAAHLKAGGVSQTQIDSILGPSNDDAFAAALKAQGSTILGYGFEKVFTMNSAPVGTGFQSTIRPPGPITFNSTMKGPPPVFSPPQARAYNPPLPQLESAAAGIAFVNVDSDLDGIYRLEYTVVNFQDHYCVPLYLALARNYHNEQLRLELGSTQVDEVWLAQERIPVDEIGRMMVNFRGPEGTIPHYSISDIIQHKVPPTALAGKIVLVGVTAQAIGDRLITPVSAFFPGVEIQASALDTVLRGDFISRNVDTTDTEERLGALVLGAFITVVGALLGAAWSLGAALVLAFGYIAYAQRRLLTDHVYIKLIFPLGTTMITFGVIAAFRYFTEGREKAYLRDVFSHYLHPDIVDNLVDNPELLQLGGERCRLAVLFADVVGSTTLAERMDPQALVDMLTTYMTEMIEIITSGSGVVDKLMGDGIMAFWGAPNVLENPSKAALDAAVKMLAKLRDLREHDPRFAHFNIGMGIHTGEVTVGNFGGRQFFNYTAIGDPVNFASRLEGLTRKFKVNLLVSRDTLEEAGANYVARDVGRVVVKGKAIAVPIAEVVGDLNDGVDPGFYKDFEQVVELVRSGSLDQARAALDRLAKVRPDDAVVHLYIEKLSDATAARSDGGELVFEFDTK